MNAITLVSISISHVAKIVQRIYKQATVDGLYQDLAVIKKQRANDYAAERVITQDIVILEAELRELK